MPRIILTNFLKIAEAYFLLFMKAYQHKDKAVGVRD